MHFLDNLSIRSKLLLLTTPLLIFLTFFTLIVVYKLDEDRLVYNKMNSFSELSLKIADLVHELQKERGYAAVFITTKARPFKDKVNEQREETDEVSLSFYRSLDKYKGKIKDFYIKDKLNTVLKELGKLETTRKSIDKFQISREDEIKYYTNINSEFLYIISRLMSGMSHPGINTETALFSLQMQINEFAGLERAVLSSVFGQKKMEKNEEKELIRLISLQDNLEKNLKNSANSTWLARVNEKYHYESFMELSLIRKAAFAGSFSDYGPENCFNISTNKINMLKTLEDELSHSVRIKSQDLFQNANFSFYLYLSIFFVLALTNLFLIRHIIKSISSYLKELEDYSERIAGGESNIVVPVKSKDEIGHLASVLNLMLKSLFNTQKDLEKERNEISYLYKESQVIFKNVRQGLFLINKDNVISSQYSDELCTIFNTSDIAGKSFLDFMQPILTSRDRQALDLFTQHLFNRDIDEEVLNALNPLEKVQIFIEKETVQHETKYLKFTFRRIYDEDKIYNVLVTVLDETRAIELEKRFDEIESKNKDEMELVLGILNIEPEMLNDFLDRTEEVLLELTESFESERTEDHYELASFIFRNIHNMKGNASILDLHRFVKRFEEIETIIVDIRSKETIRGDDFLKVLFEISEVNNEINEMRNLIDRMHNVSEKLKGQVPFEQENEKLLLNLNRNVNRIARELNKKAQFVMENTSGVQIPARLKLPFKDILVQLIRNSLVHGIEYPPERNRKNKNETATLQTKINENNGYFSFSYRDDGKGLDVDLIKKRLVEAKRFSPEKIENMGKTDLVRLILSDGFSTQIKATEHAGRGQGMGLIREIIKKYSGKMKIAFKKDHYFEMDIDLKA